MFNLFFSKKSSVISVQKDLRTAQRFLSKLTDAQRREIGFLRRDGMFFTAVDSQHDIPLHRLQTIAEDIVVGVNHGPRKLSVSEFAALVRVASKRNLNQLLKENTFDSLRWAYDTAYFLSDMTHADRFMTLKNITTDLVENHSEAVKGFLATEIDLTSRNVSSSLPKAMRVPTKGDSTLTVRPSLDQMVVFVNAPKHQWDFEDAYRRYSFAEVLRFVYFSKKTTPLEQAPSLGAIRAADLPGGSFSESRAAFVVLDTEALGFRGMLSLVNLTATGTIQRVIDEDDDPDSDEYAHPHDVAFSWPGYNTAPAFAEMKRSMDALV